MATTYGITTTGFVGKKQADIVTEMNARLQSVFGANINLGADSYMGQLVGIFSEREALLWELAEAVYNSQYPSGAEGASVDNILALRGQRRLTASPTVTDPTPVTQGNGITLNGLMLYGTAGTVVPAGSQIKTSTTPPYTFTTDADYTIQAAVNAVQNLIFSNTPASGTYTLSLVDTAGNTLTTPTLYYDTLSNTSKLTWATPPNSGTFRLMFDSYCSALFSYSASASTIQTNLQALGGNMASVTVSAISGGFSFAWPTNGFAFLVSVANTALSFPSAPTSGTFSLVVNGTTTAALPYNATTTQIQTELAKAGYPRALASTNNLTTGRGWNINWVGTAVPTVTIASQSTNQTLSVGSTYSLNQAATIRDSLQATIDAYLYDAALGTPSGRAFSNATVVGTYPTYTITFGNGVLPAGTDTTVAGTAIPTMTVATNTLQSGGNVTNVSVVQAQQGNPAQAIGSATCTQTGAITVLAGQLNVIGSSVSGWSSVTNQLDCITGTSDETDTEAITRSNNLLASNANGTLQSIVQNVEQVSGVTAAAGFQNVFDAALQSITLTPTPVSGNYQLQLNGAATGNISATATAFGVQTAIQAVSGYSSALVIGTAATGFLVDFNGSMGGQRQPLMQVLSNTTESTITVAFGRSAKSFEIVVQGGSNLSIAKAIYNAMPAGVYSYSAPVATTTATVTYGSPVITVAANTGIAIGQAAYGYGLPANTLVSAVVGNAITLTQNAIGNYSGTTVVFNNSAQVTGSNGNQLIIGFSRPTTVPFYVTVTLLTDTYNTPGNPASGVNLASKFSVYGIAQLQADIAAIGNSTTIGGLVVGYGTNGLIGAFNEVPGIVGYTLNFGTTPNPSTNTNVQLLPTQIATFQVFNIAVSYT